jgi:ABC-type uncharacterized transport system ATPase subunit
MPIALELRRVCKRFGAGAGRCVIYADVLRDVDLTVHAGDAVAVIGERGSGKSTLLLCAAGLAAPESGEIGWFGDRSRAAAARRAIYHSTRADLLRVTPPTEQRVHLVDTPASRGDGEDLAAWIAQRRRDGDAVVVATEDAGRACELASRAFMLRDGRLQSVANVRSRVAEGAAP